jgi:hypothetical protein
VRALLTLLATLLALTGCGLDVGDLNRRILVYAIGVDQGAPGATRLTILYSSPTGTTTSAGAALGTAGGSYIVQTAEGDTPAAALGRIARAASGRLWLGSVRLIVFGEAYAAHGIARASAFLARLPEVPDRTYAVVARGTAAAFLGRPSSSAGNAASHVVEMLDGQGATEIAARAVPIFRLFDQAFAPAGSVFVPEFAPSGTFPRRVGLAVFRGDRLVARVGAPLASLVAAAVQSGPAVLELPAQGGWPLTRLVVRRLETRLRGLRFSGGRLTLSVAILADGATVDDESASLTAPEALARHDVARHLAAAAAATLSGLYAAGADPLDVGEKLREHRPDGEPPPPELLRHPDVEVTAVVREAAVPIGT